MFAYDDEWARIMLMYRLQSRRVVGNTLFLCGPERAGRGTIRNASQFAGDVVQDSPEFLERYPAESFDVVVLHDVLSPGVRGRRWAGEVPYGQALLQASRRVLVSGGLLTGSTANVLGGAGSGWFRRGGTTASSCMSKLLRAGFADTQCHLALPSAYAPRSIVSCERRAARQFFRDQLDRQRAEL